jgi:hypothetical protein
MLIPDKRSKMMKRFIIITILTIIGLFSLVQPATAQTIPSTRGMKAFSLQTRFLSMPGYLRWQYFTENNKWISTEEARELVEK